jgi:hypothetical protein
MHLAMMALQYAFLLLSILSHLTLASYNNASVPFLGAGDHTFAKRWYGVRTPNGNNTIDGWGPWPTICNGETQPIRYCFGDSRSQTNLQGIVNQAVSNWAPAIKVSKMTIGLDNEDSPVCDPGKNRADALVITDGTKTDATADEYNWEHCDKQATTGYMYGSKATGRHTLEFCDLVPGSEEATKPYAVRSMTHELGRKLRTALSELWLRMLRAV